MRTTIKLLYWIAIIIIFWTVWMISVVMFIVLASLFVTIKLLKTNILCKLFGHIQSGKPKHGIVRCKRCNYPIYRIK